MVVPGSSTSYSGISRYKDFLTDLPVNLAKKILGFLDEPTLRICNKVSKRWQLLAIDTLREIEFRKSFNEKIMEFVKSKDSNVVSPNYANIVKIRVPTDGDKPSSKEGQLKMKLVQMEERNIYCGGYFTTDVMDKRDPHRVVDFGGKTLMAVGSKDGAVLLLYVSMEAKVISVLRGNVVQIRAVRLCEDKGLVITGSFDAIIRCWNLKSETCVMTLLGHTGAVNCLDVYGDRLVSGAKDCTVKIWSLENGKLCDEYNFKHPSSVQCVKISQTRVYSSCDKGQVKIWDLETASVLKMIDAHQSSVRCLFFNEWHLLTGDSKGLVMAWSTNCEAKDCLKIFNHPTEVRSLTLAYLRVVTGCDDGKIRIFNFLTGVCLRVIVAGSKSNHILSVHFHETSIVVNSMANVKQHNFGEVFWDYADSADKKHVRTGEGMTSDSSKLPPGTAPPRKVSSPVKMHNRRKSFPNLPCFARRTQEQSDSVKVTLSEKATTERIKKRGPHHPPTRDSTLLKINAIQRATCMDEVALNMQRNARLRDDWGSPASSIKLATKVTDSKASKANAPRPKRAPNREVSTAPGHIIRPLPPQVEKTKSQSAKTQRLLNKSVKDVAKKESTNVSGKSLSDLQKFVESFKNVEREDLFNADNELELLTATQLEEGAKSQSQG
uniref:F-box and WD repeat domain containing 10 n=1 Tax=Neogobius melanostomus TaxID=47308 RepID=A0A8C6SA46_9GOBI